MPDGNAAAEVMTPDGKTTGRLFGRRIRRTMHQLLCLVPLYRQRAERDEAASTTATTPKPISTDGVKAANAAASVPQARRVPLSDKDAVGRLLGDIKTRGLHATAGKIQLVHLDSVRRRFAERWPSVSARAMALAEQVLREELDEEDIFTRYENFAFVIVFSMIDDAVAQGRATAISSRIHDRLMTDPELAQVFDVTTATAPVDALAGDESEVTPEALGEALAAEPVGHDLSPIRGASALLGDVFIGYQPVFQVAERQLGVFIALPQRKTPDGEVLFGARAFPEGSVATEEFDKLFTDHVINDLLLPVHAGKHRLVGTVMSHYSLSKSARLIYRLGQIPEAMRSRFIVEIIGTPDDATPDALAGIVRKLRNVAGHIALRVGLRDGELARFAECGFGVLSCDLSEADLAALEPGERDAAIAAFLTQVKAMEARAHIYGAATTGAVKSAILAGADFVSGDAIGLCTQKPQPVRPAEF
jgi:hypothetical protein